MFIECHCTSEHFIFMISFNQNYEIVFYPETALRCWYDPISEPRTQLSCTSSTNLLPLPCGSWGNSLFPCFSLWPLPDPTWFPVCRCGFVGCSFCFFPLCLPTTLEKPPTIFDYHFCPWLVSWLTSHGSTVTVSTPASPANASSFSIPFDGSDGILVLGNERTNLDYGYLATFNGAEI